MSINPQVNVTHDLVIERAGVRTGFMLEPGARVSQANTFAGKVSMGPITHSEMDLWQVLEFLDWSHGAGEEKLGDDAARYLMQDGGIKSSIAGELTLAPMWRVSDSGFVANCFYDAGNYCFAGGASSIRYYNPTTDTWADAKTGLAAACVALESYGGALYAALGDGSDMIKCADPSGAPTTWTQVTGHKARALKRWRKLLICGYQASIVTFDNATTWTTVALGDPSTNVLWIAVQDSRIVVAKDEGLYVSSDASTFDPVLIDIPQYTGNFAQMRGAQGWLYFNVLAEVERISGLSGNASLQLITPKYVGDDTYGWGVPVAVATSSKSVWVLFHNAHNSFPALLEYNQQGWHPGYVGTGGATAKTCYFSRVAGRLFVNDGSTRAQRYSTLNDGPYPDYDTSQGHEIQFTHVDAKLAEITKMTRDIIVETEGCSTTEYIEFYYQLDNDGTWTLFGTATTSPQATIMLDSLAGAVQSKDIWIKAIFYTGDSSKTPVLKGMFLRYIPRPDPMYSLSVTVRLQDYIDLLPPAKDAVGTAQDENTAGDLLRELRACNDYKLPLKLETMDGLTRFMVMSNLAWQHSGNGDVVDGQVTRYFIAPITFADVAEAVVYVLEYDLSDEDYSGWMFVRG